MQKILIIVSAVLSIGAAALGYLNHGTLTKEKSEKSAAIAERDSAKKSAAALTNDLKATKEKLAACDADAQKTVAENADLKSQIEKANASVSDVQKQLSEKDLLISQQKSDLTAKDARIAELESAGGSKQTNNAAEELKIQLQEKENLANGLQAKLKDAEAQLSELRQREAQRRSKSMRTGLEGRILAVNPSWNFVVLSLGDRQGVVNNAEMLIKRGSQLIGKVRITSVEPSTSIADIVANSVRSGLAVQPGDSVIYTGPESESDAKP